MALLIQILFFFLHKCPRSARDVCVDLLREIQASLKFYGDDIFFVVNQVWFLLVLHVFTDFIIAGFCCKRFLSFPPPQICVTYSTFLFDFSRHSRPQRLLVCTRRRPENWNDWQICQHFHAELIARDFRLSSQISEDVRRCFDDFRTLPEMSIDFRRLC